LLWLAVAVVAQMIMTSLVVVAVLAVCVAQLRLRVAVVHLKAHLHF